MKIKKFELTIVIPEDKDPERIKTDDIVDTLRINDCDFGADDCCIEIKEIEYEK